MSCFSPLTAWRSAEVGSSGKRKMVFDHSKAMPLAKEYKLPCGQCIGCRLDYSRVWAIRLVHESQLHDAASFITLTYDQANLPPDASLVKKHFQDFMKRLRQELAPLRIRFYHCGEYGETTSRPHYHAVIFGYDFPDRVFFKNGADKLPVYISPMLADIWGKGFCTVGSVTFESCAYVARYMLKKQKGVTAGLASPDIDFSTGEIKAFRQPEYCTMSRKPGIAADWYDKFKSDVYPLDRVVINGKQVKPPRFYDSRYEIENPDDFARIKAERIQSAKKHKANNTPERLRVRETVQLARLNQLSRGL